MPNQIQKDLFKIQKLLREKGFTVFAVYVWVIYRKIKNEAYNEVGVIIRSHAMRV